MISKELSNMNDKKGIVTTKKQREQRRKNDNNDKKNKARKMTRKQSNNKTTKDKHGEKNSEQLGYVDPVFYLCECKF